MPTLIHLGGPFHLFGSSLVIEDAGGDTLLPPHEGRFSILQAIDQPQIEQLRIEATDAGDTAQAALCELAAAGDAAALIECARVVAATWAAELDARHFAAIDGESFGLPSGAVYGIGRSAEEALADARRAELGDYAAVPCTAAAFRYVEAIGGAPSRELIVSRRGVRLLDEAE